MIPPNLIVSSYFPSEKRVIDELTQREEIIQEIEELTLEHSGEEGLLEDAKNNKGKLTKTSLKERLKDIKSDASFEDEIIVIKQAQRMLDKESSLTTNIKAEQLKLNKKIVSCYNELDIEAIKELVVVNKWFNHLSNIIIAEIENIIQNLANRVIELEKRYANPVPELVSQVLDHSKRVEKHLKKWA